MERTEPNPWLPPASVPPPGYEAPEAPRPPYEEQRRSLGQRLLGPIVAAGVLLGVGMDLTHLERTLNDV